MTKVAPITDEELARLERLYEEAREERHEEEEESGETNSTIARCLFHDEAEERFLSLIARLRAAEARAETAEAEGFEVLVISDLETAYRDALGHESRQRYDEYRKRVRRAQELLSRLLLTEDRHEAAEAAERMREVVGNLAYEGPMWRENVARFARTWCPPVMIRVSPKA